MGSPDDLAWLENLTESEKKALLAEVTSELNSNKLADYKPFAKQIEFHSAGADEGVHPTA